MIIKMVVYYTQSDETEDFESAVAGDYYGVELYIGDTLIKTFGDDYHDKGIDKANAWIDGFIWAYDSEFKIERYRALLSYDDESILEERRC